MATSLLEPDSSVWNTPLLLKGDDTPDALRPDPQADALGQTYSAITDYMARQQQQSADRGLWDNTTGLPTQKGLLDAIGQTGTAVALGTGSGGEAPAPGFTAYHGSPHAFDQFDLSKIGTGEGAQAYGHGMYLADSEGVARSYRDQLAPTQNLNDLIDKHGGDGDAAFTDLLTKGDYTASELDAMMKYQRTGERPPAGHMYEVNVNADPATFLDWDRAPSPDQAKLIEQGHDTSRWPSDWANSTGADIHQIIGRDLMVNGGVPSPTGGIYDAKVAAQLASESLKSAGIPGIRYLDRSSRGAGEGTKNTVVFDPATMDIIRRYGLAGLMAGGGAAALGGQSGQQQ